MERQLRSGYELPLRTVTARNTAAHEAGSIHDDAYAARMGYRGGLVPGVTLLAYLTPSLVDAFGAAWPQRGRLHARFLRPAYDGETLVVRASVTRREGNDAVLACQIARPDEPPCVEAQTACLLGEAPLPEARPWRRSIPVAARSSAADGELPPLTPETLVVGQELAPLTYRLSLEEAQRWAAEAGDDSPWYRESSPPSTSPCPEGSRGVGTGFGRPIVHPAWFARDPIALLRHNFACKATLHAATDLAYQGIGWPEREYTVYGVIADVYERKGHSYTVVDCLTVDQDGREIVRQRHTSLIRLRAEVGG